MTAGYRIFSQQLLGDQRLVGFIARHERNGMPQASNACGAGFEKLESGRDVAESGCRILYGLLPATTHPGRPENGRSGLCRSRPGCQAVTLLSAQLRGLRHENQVSQSLPRGDPLRRPAGHKARAPAARQTTPKPSAHRIFLDGVFDGVCTTVAVHAFYPEYCCFHPNLHLVLQTSERAILHLRASSRIILPAGNLNRPGLGHGRRFREIASNVAVWESGPIRKFLFCKLRAHFRPE